VNQSQLILRELSESPERAIAFLNKLRTLISIQKRNWSRVIIAYLLGIVTALVLILAFSDATFISLKRGPSHL